MRIPTEVQILKQGGKPAFAVLPYNQYLALIGTGDDEVCIPHEVMGLCVEGLSLIAAWRTHKGLSQTQLAERLGMTQPAVAQIERFGARLQKRTVEKVAVALGVNPEHLVE